MVSRLARSNAGEDALRVEEREEAVGLQQRQRHRQVAGVLVDLVAAVLTLAAQRLQRRDDARHQLHDDRRVDVRVHRPMPRSRSGDRPPPENRSSSPTSALLETKLASAPGRCPAPAPTPAARKTISIPRTKRIRRRMSGARNALSSDSNTGQASPDGCVGRRRPPPIPPGHRCPAAGRDGRPFRCWRPARRRASRRLVRRRSSAAASAVVGLAGGSRIEPPWRASGSSPPSTPSAGIAVVGTSRTFTTPPAASIFSRA